MNNVILVVLDGLGYRKSKEGNAVRRANMPFFHSLLNNYPNSFLKAHGRAVGLPEGYMGNSEVGHENLGAGRVVKQEILLINEAIKNGSFFKNPALMRAIQVVKERGSSLHIMGLCSDKGVHSHIDHLLALLKMAEGVDVWVHFFADGRDSPPKSAHKYLEMIKNAKIGTVMGRYFSMDRIEKWERTKKAYEAMVNCEGFFAENAHDAIEQAYKRGETDEFIKPTIIDGYPGIKDGDAVINFNYRSDRERQITKAFVEKDFDDFQRKHLDIDFVSFTQYDKNIHNVQVAFFKDRPKNTLGEVISNEKIAQLRIAEAEKYAHVTFFFNGTVEKPYPFEDRIIVPDPEVATYDLMPEMSIYEVTDKVIEGIESKKYGFILLNFANPDMVGHTANIDAAVFALEAVDSCLKRVVEAAKQDYSIIITADHGNCEEMVGEYETSHTTNPVRVIVVDDARKVKKGALGDVAPTVLKLMGIKKPSEMTGKPLV